MARPLKKSAALTAQLKARFTDEEAARLRKAAAQRGVSVSDLIRSSVLERPLPGRRRAAGATADLQALTKLLAHLGRLGGNINQLAKRANLGGWPEREDLLGAVRDVRAVRETIMRALSVDPSGGKPKGGAPSGRSRGPT